MPAASCLCRYPKGLGPMDFGRGHHGFFDNINHDWLLANVHMNKRILPVVEKQVSSTEDNCTEPRWERRKADHFADIGEHHPERVGARTQPVPQTELGSQSAARQR